MGNIDEKLSKAEILIEKVETRIDILLSILDNSKHDNEESIKCNVYAAKSTSDLSQSRL